MVPGTLTSAYLALKLWAPGVRTRVMAFDQILEEVAAGRAEAGLIIHEGQLTFGAAGLHKALDLGVWWKDETSLPLPLGGNAVRRDLGDARMKALTKLVRETVRYSLEHRPQALEYAMSFARGMQTQIADRFVGMWVNDMTLDWASAGARPCRSSSTAASRPASSQAGRRRFRRRLTLARGAAAASAPPRATRA